MLNLKNLKNESFGATLLGLRTQLLYIFYIVSSIFGDISVGSYLNPLYPKKFWKNKFLYLRLACLAQHCHAHTLSPPPYIFSPCHPLSHTHLRVCHVWLLVLVPILFFIHMLVYVSVTVIVAILIHVPLLVPVFILILLPITLKATLLILFSSSKVYLILGYVINLIIVE